jgi:hypothetical protein
MLSIDGGGTHQANDAKRRVWAIKNGGRNNNFCCPQLLFYSHCSCTNKSNKYIIRGQRHTNTCTTTEAGRRTPHSKPVFQKHVAQPQTSGQSLHRFLEMFQFAAFYTLEVEGSIPYVGAKEYFLFLREEVQECALVLL